MIAFVIHIQGNIFVNIILITCDQILITCDQIGASFVYPTIMGTIPIEAQFVNKFWAKLDDYVQCIKLEQGRSLFIHLSSSTIKYVCDI